MVWFGYREWASGASALSNLLGSARVKIVFVEPKAIAHAAKSRRTVASIVATILLAAQLIIAGHVHPDLLIKTISDRAHAAVVGEAACPVCALHAHTSTGTAAAFLLIIPFLNEAFVATARRSRLLYSAKSQLFGRAPPASA
jgi:hypothetical protein